MTEYELKAWESTSMRLACSMDNWSIEHLEKGSRLEEDWPQWEKEREREKRVRKYSTYMKKEMQERKKYLVGVGVWLQLRDIKGRQSSREETIRMML